jgi:hypothetical protein
MKSQIFISYRREDSAHAAGRLFDRLSQRFGKDRIFMDIDTIELGVDFIKRIENAVGNCDVVIALIGKDWLNIENAEELRRLEDPNDFVRLEISTALERDIFVIPVLIDGAAMPLEEELPDVLALLARRNGTPLDYVRFDTDVDKLINALEDTIKRITKARKKERRTSYLLGLPLWGWFTGLIVVLSIIGIVAFNVLRRQNLSQRESLFYDGFETPEFDGSFDQILWDSFGEEFGQIYQENSNLVISHEISSEDDKIGLDARAYKEHLFEAPTFFEATLLMENPELSDATHNGRISIGLFSNSASEEYTGCNLEQSNEQAQFICYFMDGSRDETVFHTGYGLAEYGKWYTYRIEVYPTTMTFTYLINDRIVGSYKPKNADELKSANYELSLGVNGFHSGNLIGRIDDVKIGNIDQ